jgi:hypothetical protein
VFFVKQAKGKALYGLIGILGIVAAVLPLAIYHFVETAGMKGMAMDCESACLAETFVGAAITAIAVVSLFIKNAKLSLAGSSALLAGGIATIAVPQLIGFCKSDQMACRYLTAPTLTVIGVAIIALALVRVVSGLIALRRTAAAAQ